MPSRKLLRGVHILVAVMLAAYLYSPTLNASAEYTFILQVIVLPVVALSGIAMWQQGRLARLLRSGG